ncbi:flagellin N-terminal helical domain-containing protein [Clostridium psychrophilum]|uniref:flagellin N-terminal helical domain-containing protein n=1 Tax=Clostridium psychrophilum TaxID=132926 RepID=UPI001C0AAD4A|nr:flagellin [Clostridium psychrophilum]MBU3180649.1 flagellin [Clostridium psychrophilum]
MIISTSSASLKIYRAYTQNLTKQSGALNNISSGIKINSAKDDPIGIAQSERFRMQIRGLQMAGENTQDGVSMLQTAEGGLDGITSNLQRIRELLVEAGGVTTDSDKNDIQTEINQNLKGIDDMTNNTEFNGVKLLAGGKPDTIPMVIGANEGEKVDIPVFDLTTATTGLDLNTTTVDVNNTDDSLKIVDKALSEITSARSKYGALENRFTSTYNSTMELSEKLESADSGLRDADLAGEMIEYSKDNILIQAGTAMMVQSNKLPQDALQILSNIRSR